MPLGGRNYIFCTPLYARSLQQCIELSKQVVKYMYFKILTISVALDLSFLSSEKVGCLHIYECVCECECVLWGQHVCVCECVLGVRVCMCVNVHCGDSV